MVSSVTVDNREWLPRLNPCVTWTSVQSNAEKFGFKCCQTWSFPLAVNMGIGLLKEVLGCWGCSFGDLDSCGANDRRGILGSELGMLPLGLQLGSDPVFTAAVATALGLVTPVSILNEVLSLLGSLRISGVIASSLLYDLSIGVCTVWPRAVSLETLSSSTWKCEIHVWRYRESSFVVVRSNHILHYISTQLCIIDFFPGFFH